MISLNSPKLASSRTALDAAKAKAKALLESKGKTIEKSDPNYVRVKKRKNGEESGRKRMENVAKALKDDDEEEIEKIRKEEKEKEKVKKSGRKQIFV